MSRTGWWSTATKQTSRRARDSLAAHAALDRAVWAACGWDDADPATVDEDTLLSRLRALNQAR
jgi:hypothetical protein